MRIENIDSDPVISIILDELSNQIASHSLGSVDQEREKSNTKNDVINSILISLGAGIAASTIFELLKAVLSQHLSNLDKDSKIAINGSEIHINVVINNKFNSLVKDNEQEK